MEKRVVFRSRWLPYVLVAPQIVITLVFFFWPAGQALYQSLLRQDAFGINLDSGNFTDCDDPYAELAKIAPYGVVSQVKTEVYPGGKVQEADLAKVVKADTIAVGPPDCIAPVPVPEAQKRAVAPGQSHDIEGIHVEVVPAYNIDKPFHPKTNNWVGYILELDGRRIYHAGDTDRIPMGGGSHAWCVRLPTRSSTSHRLSRARRPQPSASVGR